MKIYIMRHGETDWNSRHVFQGQVNTSLNADGRRQAEKAREKIRAMGLSFDKVYSSPIPRAMETTEIVTGLDRSGIIADDRLKEMDFGPLDGTPFDRGAKGVGHLFDAPELYVPPEGAESFRHLEERLASFYDELRMKKPGRSILVGCHGCAIRMTMVWMGYLKFHEMWNQGIGNCAIIEADLGEDNFYRITKIHNTQDYIAAGVKK